MTREGNDLRIVFMGTPGFAVGVLDKLIDAGENICAVVTAPDRPAGRGRKLRETDVKKCAQKNIVLYGNEEAHQKRQSASF